MTKTSLPGLWARDEGRCWICGRVVPEPGTVGHTDPDAPTRDHVIQRRKGGTNGLGNLRLAHQRCNLARETPLVDAPIHHHLPRAWHHHLEHLPHDQPLDLDDLLDITLELIAMPRPRPIAPDDTIGTVTDVALHPHHAIDTSRRQVHNLTAGQLTGELTELLGDALTIHLAGATIGLLRRIRGQKHALVPDHVRHRLRTAVTCTRILHARNATDDDTRLWFVHHADELHTTPLDRIRGLEPDDQQLTERILHTAHTQNLN